MLEIAPRVRAREAIPRIVFKIVPRVHRSRFGHVCDQGFHDGVFEITPRVRARGAITNTELEMTLRVRARDPIMNVVLENTSRARALKHLPIK